MSWCQTYAGVVSWPLDPDRNTPQDILVADIAHSLAYQCRFNGHCKVFYSVAQHSVIIADTLFEQTKDLTIAQQGLLHDATETYLGDIPRPMKTLMPDFKSMEAKWMQKIFDRFGVEFPLNPEIKIADDRLLRTEAEQFMVWPPPIPWSGKARPYDFKIEPLGPEEAKELFLRKMEYYNIISESELKTLL
nr:hypothetical protein 29 [bacterium]